MFGLTKQNETASNLMKKLLFRFGKNHPKPNHSSRSSPIQGGIISGPESTPAIMWAKNQQQRMGHHDRREDCSADNSRNVPGELKELLLTVLLSPRKTWFRQEEKSV